MFRYNLFIFRPRLYFFILVLSTTAFACAAEEADDPNPQQLDMEPNTREYFSDSETEAGEEVGGEAGEEIAPDDSALDSFDPNLNELENCDHIITYMERSFCFNSLARQECYPPEVLESNLENILRAEMPEVVDENGNLTIKVNCTDADQDCHYECEDWDLGDHQDPDDRRASIPNSNQPTPTTNCIGVDNDSYSACTMNLYTESSMEQIIQYYPCANQGHVWVTQTEDSDQAYHIYVDTLNDSAEPPISSLTFNSQPEQIACYFDRENGALSLILSTKPRARFINKLYGLNSSADVLDPINLSEMRDLRDYTFINEMLLSSLEVNTTGLFTWFAQTSLIDRAKIYYFANRFALEEHAPDIEQEEALCLNCLSNRIRPRLAQLNSSGQVFIQDQELEDDNLEPYQLFETEGPFQAIASSQNFLGLVPAGNTVTEIYFSLWSDPLPSIHQNSLLDFPLVFDLEQWSDDYEHVELKSIVGDQALLRLKVNDEEGKFIWAVYQILSDHLIIISLDTSADDDWAQLELNENAEWLNPQLHEDQVIWPINNSGDSNRLALKFIKIELSE